MYIVNLIFERKTNTNEAITHIFLNKQEKNTYSI